MNIQNAIDIILEQKEYKNARAVLDLDKDKTKEYLLKRIEERITPDFTFDNNEQVYLLLALSAQYRVNSFNAYYHFFSDNSITKDENRRNIISSDLFVNAFAYSISNSKELKQIEDLFFHIDMSDIRQAVIVNVVYSYWSNLVGKDESENSDLSEIILQRDKCLIGYFSKVVNWIYDFYKSPKSIYGDDFEGAKRHNEIYCILRLIAKYYYENEYHIDSKTRSMLLSVIVQIIITSEISHNNSLFREYFRLLKLLSPHTYCEALHISDYIRNMRKTLYKENIFKASTLEKVGQILYRKIQDDTECSEEILKLAIQIIHRYPLNKRNKPIKDEEYYEEITAYLDINIVPSESLTIAQNQYYKVRAEFMLLIDRIRELEKKCDERIKESKIRSEELKQKNGRNSLYDDTTEIRKSILIEMQKSKELGALYKRKERSTSDDETGGDSYLEYCINYLYSTFALFIEDEKTKEEVNETLQQWVMMDVSRGLEYAATESIYNIEERFIPYLNIIEKFKTLIDDDPSKTIKRMRLWIKSYLFEKDITDKHKKLSGAKLFDHSSEEYRIFIKELKGHSLSIEKTISITDANEYLKVQKNIIEDAINRIMNNIGHSLCLKKRKNLIEEIVSLFRNKKYAAVINMIPIQIEGLFADYLDNSLIYKSDLKMKMYEQIYSSLFMEKAMMAEMNDLNIGFETIGYFRYYFNSVYRNTVAHGNYWLLLIDYTESNKIDIEKASMILAHDLILDLNYLVDVVANSNEIDEAKSYLEYTAASLGGFESDVMTDKTDESDTPSVDDEEIELREISRLDRRYERFYLDLLGESRFNSGNYKKGFFISHNPIQLLFWIFNPLIESEIGGCACIKIREVLLSQEFWNYVIKKLQRGVIFNDCSSLDNVVKHLMPKFKEDETLHNLAIEVRKTIKHLNN